MENNNYNFTLNTNDLSELRYIKLDKKASYTESWNKLGSEEKGQDSIAFYSYGFYDVLTCFRASEFIDYMEHFHISLPSDRDRKTMKVEQWFGIFPVDQEITSTEADIEMQDPFFCKEPLSLSLPFLGVILISLSNLSGDFKGSLGEFVDNIKSQLSVEDDQHNDIRYIFKLYYSLNCADLCLVIRTDSLNYIHKANRTIEKMAQEKNTEINTTVIFSVQPDVSINDLNALNSKNETVSFIVRSDLEYKKYLEENNKQDIENTYTQESFNGISYGVNGTGKFVTKLSYQQYSEFLPDLMKYKLGLNDANKDEMISTYVQSICHEREWFAEEIGSGAGIVGLSIPQRKICGWIFNVREKIQNIDKAADSFFTFSNGCYVYKKMFEREFRLVKDLVDTYSDLLYKKVSKSGYIFFAQISIALNGIEKMLEEMQKIELSDVLEQSVQYLYETIHFIACDLNGYNKQFQYLNQDSVNFPSYEIQSKVNSEKYMAAYSAFLHRFFVAYYKNKGNEEYIVQSFPLALIDITQRKIVTRIYFSSLYKEKQKAENSKKRSLFSVHFPSAEYFANIWNSIPLLMHEIFHTLHYGETKERNEALVYSIDVYFAETIVGLLLNIINEGTTINNSLLLEILRKPVYDTIVRERTEFFEVAPKCYAFQRFSDWRFREVKDSCQEFYGKVFDSFDDVKNISYKQKYAICKKIKEDLGYILQCIDFTEICCAFNTIHDEVPKELYYAANLLYLYFDPSMYQTYQQQYDSFFKRLRMDIEQADKENLKPLFSFVAYKCKRFDKNGNLPRIGEIKKNNSENDKNSWYRLMEIVLVAGMISVFEEYQKKLFDENYQKNYMIYCEDIIPRPYYDNVNDYSRKLEEVYQNSDLSKQDKRILKDLFHEYLELYCSVNNLVRFLADEKLSELEELEDDTGDFMRVLHKECYGYIHKLIKEGKSQDFNAVFTRTNREQLVKLGLIDEESDVFKKVYETLLSKVDADFVKDTIADRVSLFQEVYADCGMCSAIGFDFFGYCMFSLSNHNTVNDFTATNEEANFLADRIRAVAGMYFGTEDNADLEEAKSFIAKLFDKKMILAIIQMLDSVEHKEKLGELRSQLLDNNYIPNFLSLKKTKEVFLSVTKWELVGWIDNIIAPLLIVLERGYESKDDISAETRKKILLAKTYLFNLYSVLEIFYREDIFVKLANQRDPFNSYFYQLKDKITDIHNKEIVFVKEQKCIEEIRRFYNLEFPDSEENIFDQYFTLYRFGFVEQCNFIFEYYCEYKNSYCGIINRAKEDEDFVIEDWYEMIDNYYLGKEA